MPLLLLPLAFIAFVVWFVLSRKPAPRDALLVSPALSSSSGAPPALGAASSARALPRGATRALPPA